MKAIFILIFMLSSMVSFTQKKALTIKPGSKWTDTDNKPINAHGGGILYYGDTYYFYGEIKRGPTWLVPYQSWECYRVLAGGISCYSSKDLVNWKNEGIALRSTTGDSSSDLDTSKVIERPKVIYNSKTGKFVMWMHIDKNDYSYSRSGVAVSDHPIGPFKYLNSVWPNESTARDMTIFQDEDGKAYHFFTSEQNNTMHVVLLTDDYLSHTKVENRILVNQIQEAPAVFKYKKKYYLITSQCTGWAPNPASLAIADNIMGEWIQYENPCKGKKGETTFLSQSTFVLPLKGKSDSFIFMADRWNKSNLEDSRYIWLPLKMIGGKPEIKWYNKWNLSQLP